MLHCLTTYCYTSVFFSVTGEWPSSIEYGVFFAVSHAVVRTNDWLREMLNFQKKKKNWKIEKKKRDHDSDFETESGIEERRVISSSIARWKSLVKFAFIDSERSPTLSLSKRVRNRARCDSRKWRKEKKREKEREKEERGILSWGTWLRGRLFISTLITGSW